MDWECANKVTANGRRELITRIFMWVCTFGIVHGVRSLAVEDDSLQHGVHLPDGSPVRLEEWK